ncbi:MAG TPA: NUDIX domain-containing protein [Phenylobacterium sp.]|uniref:NUDIX domain-containing protein n=1 Tax=Phenylobacterium sp. TaxID=1871053 RepID=UPI002B49AA61|nr:NUDIX domain-containing protein [Phenylobacterium sp.]HKR88123.1 NUDIX domain-containing protein [Phenylobacterium sp.]
MSQQVSAGLAVWRRVSAGPEILLVHPGGPYWRGKDEAAWSIPKGLAAAGEDLAAAARREFAEELGIAAPEPQTALSPRKLPGGKVVHAWLAEADLDLSDLRSNLFEIEWPPRSGRTQAFPEVDQAGYFARETALAKAHRGQRPLVAEAFERIGS